MSEIQVIDVGSAPDDDTGDSLRLMAQKINETVAALLETINLRAPALHSHSQSDVSGLVAALAEKATTAYVDSQISTVSGNVSSEAAARASADSGLDTRLGVVETWKTSTTGTVTSLGNRMNAAEDAIDALEASVTGVDDFSGRVTAIETKRGSLLENADGAFTGTELISGATDRDGFVVQTDKFGIKTVGSTLLVPFENSGGISYLKPTAIRARDLSSGSVVQGVATAQLTLTMRTGSLALILSNAWGAIPAGTASLVVEDITSGVVVLSSVAVNFIGTQALPVVGNTVDTFGAGSKTIRVRLIDGSGNTVANGAVRMSILEICR